MTKIHDNIFAIGSLILGLALLPSVINGAVLPLSTSLTTFVVLLVFAATFAHMKYWRATGLEIVNVVFWGLLTIQSLGH